MSVEKLRAWWWRKQGLDGSLSGKRPAEVLEKAGWARSVAGIGPYLTLFSRAGIGREAADRAVAKLEIHELPAARGCTYVVPVSEFALALRVGQGFGVEAEMKVARKLGVKDAEIDKLKDKVVSAVGQAPLLPDEIRETVGSTARSLGAEGKKKGLTTTLPLALGALQAEGEIRRIPVDGRLDQQRYRYARWTPNPLKKLELSPEEAMTELARKYFRWIGPASVDEFRWFSGLGAAAAKKALEPLGLVAVADSGDRIALPEDAKAFRDFSPPKKPSYALVSSLDGLFHHRRELASHLEAADAKRKTLIGTEGRAGGALMDLPSHAIVDRGRLVGLWEYDMDRASIVWQSFVPVDAALEKAVKMTEGFVRDEVGDARSFSLDSPKSRIPRIEALRRAGKR